MSLVRSTLRAVSCKVLLLSPLSELSAVQCLALHPSSLDRSVFSRISMDSCVYRTESVIPLTMSSLWLPTLTASRLAALSPSPTSLFAHSDVPHTLVDVPPHPEAALLLFSPGRRHVPVFSMLQISLFLSLSPFLRTECQILHRHLTFCLQSSLSALLVSPFVRQLHQLG